MINGRVFDWESIAIYTTWGSNITILAISYNAESSVEPVYGRGRAARGYGMGNLAQEGSMDIDSISFDLLCVYAAAQGGLLNIKPFPIVVNYSNADQKIRFDTLRSCKIQRWETDATQGDSEVRKTKLTFKILDPILLNGIPVL